MVHRYLNKVWKQKSALSSTYRNAQNDISWASQKRLISILFFQPSWTKQCFPQDIHADTMHRMLPLARIFASRFARKMALKEVISFQDLGPELNNFEKIILSLSHSSYCLLHQNNFDISKISEKNRKEIQYKIWRLLQWMVWKDRFSSNLDVLEKSRPPFNH